jgi:hypothetical protein
MENAVVWDLTPRSSCKNRRFRGTYLLHRHLLVTANVVPSSAILVTLMQVIRSSETSVLVRAMHRHIPEDGIIEG